MHPIKKAALEMGLSAPPVDNAHSVAVVDGHNQLLEEHPGLILAQRASAPEPTDPAIHPLHCQLICMEDVSRSQRRRGIDSCLSQTTSAELLGVSGCDDLSSKFTVAQPALRLSAPDILVEITSWYVLQDNSQVCGRQYNPFEHHNVGMAEAAVGKDLAANVSGHMLLAAWQELDSNLFTCLPAGHQIRDGAVSDQALSGSHG